MRRTVTGLLVVVMLVFGSPAVAGPDRITYGEARAHFDAFTTGGRVIFFGGAAPAVVNAGPASLFRAGIRPFPGGPWDDAFYCVDDWHVFLIAGFDGGDRSFHHSDAVASLGAFSVEWILDGAVFGETETTPIKRFLVPEGFGLETAFARQDGVFVAPGDLSVGSHSLQADLTDPLFGDFTVGPITLNVDASGTGACV